MAGSRHWPMPPARAASISERSPMAQTRSRGPGGGPSRGSGASRGPGGGPGGDRRRRGEPEGQNRDRDDSEFVEKLVGINRVAKVVKGGRRFGFAAIVIVGDRKGRVGYGSGKAREVPEAIRKATEQARKGMVRVPLREGRTLHHDIISSYGAGRVIVRAEIGRAS